MKINFNDKLYPMSLRKISTPPSQIYAEGNINLLNAKSIAIIGSRNASENGKKLAQQFAYELSETGITIVSGLALGIDTEAHKYSGKNPGKTIAVLGSGFNKLFPIENLELYKNIIKNDGLIISEYPPDEEPCSEHFRQRNRIVSGLSLGVLVIEASYTSGTGITARFAKEQGKKVFALPHEIWDAHGIGTNRLIRNGAILVTCTNDIIKELNFDYIDLKYPCVAEKSSKVKISKAAKIQKNSLPTKSQINFSDKKQATIYSLLTNSPTCINELLHKSEYSISEISSALFMLEINGYIKKVEGGYICI